MVEARRRGATERVVAAVEAAAGRGGFALNTEQRPIVERISQLATSPGATQKRGLYIYGPAGRGKSWIADACFAALPAGVATRVHFHGFFDQLHRRIQEYRDARRESGDATNDPVERAIADVTGASRLLFFDELHVHDPGDARLLSLLLAQVFARGTVVIATSNFAPDELLPNPIWHHTMEPGIALITQHMEVVRLGGATDYRSLTTDHSSGFASGRSTTLGSAELPSRAEATVLKEGGRTFPVLARRRDHLWISFAQLCESATSTIEYLSWARTFSRWTVTDVPAFDAQGAGVQQRFINVVDVLVDAGVAVTFVSSIDLQAFLATVSGRPDAHRTASRLQLLLH